MPKTRLTFASILALALLWVGAGGAGMASGGQAGQVAANPDRVTAAPSGAAASGLKGLKPRQRKARRKALRRCRKARVRAKRKRCMRRVKAKYRRIARRQARNGKWDGPAVIPPTAIREVLVTDATDEVLQSSYFFPVPEDLSPVLEGDLATKKSELLAMYATTGGRFPYTVPTELGLTSGEAVRFVWDPENRDSPHQITLFGFPAGVNPGDFEMSGAVAHGGVTPITFQRTFLEPGVYEVRCSLHQESQILKVTVTR